MIYVTLGTQPCDFSRCLKMIEELVKTRYLDEKIVVVDSLGVSLNMFSQVIYTYEEITKGTEVDVILEALKERKNNNH